MTGLRKRVTVGFLSIVALLFFSGMLSYVELNQLSHDTDDILRANKRNIELAKEMLDAAHEQNVALIHLAVLGDRSYDSLRHAGMKRLENTLEVARKEALDESFLDSLADATTKLRVWTDEYLHKQAQIPADSLITSVEACLRRDSLGRVWYDDKYEALYRQLTDAITNYMTSTQSSLAPRTEQMKKNAYRAVTPVLTSLAVMIAIVLMLYYFMTIYCVNPIIRMNKSLERTLTFHLPFGVKGTLKDEVAELKDKIDMLLVLIKQNKQ